MLWEERDLSRIVQPSSVSVGKFDEFILFQPKYNLFDCLCERQIRRILSKIKIV